MSERIARTDDESGRTAQDALRLSRLIDQQRHTIEAHWIERIRADLGRTPGVAQTDLRDGMPDYLAALVDVLRRATRTDIVAGAHSAWSDIAREHGVTRVRIGFDIDQLIHEFVVLRSVIRDLAIERGVDTLGVEALLADVVDAAIAEAVQAYVDARDYDARRKQAENIGFLTHELRNPLAVAMLSASDLRGCAAEHETQLRLLDRSLRRLSAMIDGVLLSEKLEADKVPNRPVELTLADLLEPALEAARRRARQKQLELRTRFDPAQQVWLDPALTRSAIENLVDNGVKYTDAGYVELTVEDRPRTLVFHVRDTCQGLSQQELRTIFEPFQRGRTRTQGTGLGLAITRRAVEKQGGSVHAESPEAHGCHFWIELPKREHA